MGNINKIASDYIFEQTPDDWIKLSSKAYCDSLVELIAKILETKLTDLEQNALYEKIYANNTSASSTSTSSTDKCIDLAKFYVKIAHLYATIMKTIKPTHHQPDQTKPKNNVETFYDIFMNIDSIGASMGASMGAGTGSTIYIQPIKRIMARIQARHAQLLDILKEIFKQDTIDVTSKRLQELVDIARKKIVEIYIECEEDFLTGLQMFEAIVADQIGFQAENLGARG
jgi:hypothetical protein